jgi:protein-S-isoprenylcysteine O-methyltransferase Ste14
MKPPKFLKALLAFLVLPGLLIFVIPLTWLWLTGGLQLAQPWGLALLGLGLIGILWCIRDFYVAGKGTLAPWSPPEKLVQVGLYRFTRNPMYICGVLTLLGWAVAFCSWFLLIYTLLVVIGFSLRVVRYEEPTLASQFGKEWEEYASRVPRWLW